MHRTGSGNALGALAIICLSVLCGSRAWAGRVDVALQAQGKPIADAVVSLHSPQAAAAVKPAPAVIDQRDTQFQPLVSVIHTGSRVQFPNSDNVRHQVYSFSPAKRFELPLYSGQAAAPVVFETPGVVELGCNIHDWMIAYVVVVDTPYHAISTASGQVAIEAPPGRYRLRIWHPHLPSASAPVEQDITVGAEPLVRRIDLPLQTPAARKGPSDDKLRALQDRFRKLKRDK